MFGRLDFEVIPTVRGLQNTLDTIGFGEGGFFFIACTTLLVLFFVWGAWRAALSGRGGEVQAIFTRAMIAAALLTATPTIQGMLKSGWENTYMWASEMVMRVQAESIEQLEEEVSKVNAAAGTVAAGVAQFLLGGADYSEISDGIVDSVPIVMSPGAAAVSGATTTVRANLTRAVMKNIFGHVFRLFRFLFLPIAAFYMVLIFTSGLIVTLAAVLLPLGVALLVSGQGSNMLITLIEKILSAFGSLVLIPIIFGVIFNIAVLTPVLSLFRSWNSFTDSWSSIDFSGWYVGDRWYSALSPDSWDVEGFSIGLTGLLETINQAFNLVLGGLIITAGSLLAAVLIVMALENIVSGLLRGIAGSPSAGAMAGQAAAARGLAGRPPSFRGAAAAGGSGPAPTPPRTSGAPTGNVTKRS